MFFWAIDLAGLFFGKQTGTTGGEIRHTEIRGDALSKTNPVNQSGESDEDED